MHDDFREIAHCGGQFEVTTKRDEKGRLKYSLGVRHSSGSPAAWIGVYALPQGIPVAMIRMGGFNEPWNAPPHPSCLPIFIGADLEGRFGHLCRICGGYWRSDGASALWPKTCAYCGRRGSGHEFLTEGQDAFVEEFCKMFESAILSGKDGTFTIDLDVIADKIASGAARPDFYYSEESQQNKFTCAACSEWNDILGRYAYCSTCGTRNELPEISEELEKVRVRVNAGEDLGTCVRDTVALFDVAARQYVGQLVRPGTANEGAASQTLKDKFFMI